MTGLPGLNFAAFHAMTTNLRAGGHTVTNPAELNPDGGTWNDCMHRDIAALMDCDTVATLPGWEHSKGCPSGSPDRRRSRHDGCECPRPGRQRRFPNQSIVVRQDFF
ncbi:DUF4406 domain-containing protein [Pseudomonas sp. EKM23D]|uniref:DUF4406 domain-containing protein n=1 Tax=Pseudomonas sp. EKM23D TaxID=2708062 RepID=UPI001FAE4A5A|nr:DUF4406 domain-containing protein [Pseudomonas sp. EKM23D]